MILTRFQPPKRVDNDNENLMSTTQSVVAQFTRGYDTRTLPIDLYDYLAHSQASGPFSDQLHQVLRLFILHTKLRLFVSTTIVILLS